MTLKVVHRHEKLAPESGVEFIATVSGACVSGLTNQSNQTNRLRVRIGFCTSQVIGCEDSLQNVEHDVKPHYYVLIYFTVAYIFHLHSLGGGLNSANAFSTVCYPEFRPLFYIITATLTNVDQRIYDSRCLRRRNYS